MESLKAKSTPVTFGGASFIVLMKQAKSIYLGGAIISAEDCDYDLARELGLTCPFCNAAVFWRGEHLRGDSYVSPAFCHYKLEEGDLGCEARSLTSEGRADVDKQAVIARGQRLRLYNDHLWDLLTMDVPDLNKHVKSLDSYAKKYKLVGKTMDKITRLAQKDLLGKIDDIREIISRNLDLIVSSPTEIPSLAPKDSPYSQEAIDFHKAYFSRARLALHKRITNEVLDFVCTPSGSSVLNKIIVGILMCQGVAETDWVTLVNSIPGVLLCSHWIDNIKKIIENPPKVPSGTGF